MGLERIQAPGGGSVVFHPGWAFRAMTVITLTSGTAFIMWLGEQITERGIGNGISLIIFAGIVANFPSAVITTYQFFKEGEMSLFLVLLLGRVHDRGHRLHHLHGARRAADPGAVRETRRRPKDVRRPELPPAVEDQPDRRHPADLSRRRS